MFIPPHKPFLKLPGWLFSSANVYVGQQIVKMVTILAMPSRLCILGDYVYVQCVPATAGTGHEMHR